LEIGYFKKQKGDMACFLVVQKWKLGLGIGLHLMDAYTFGKGEVIIKRNAIFKWRKVGLKIY
jgi:hypothetical protein